jgi:phosphatidylglycerophosphatase GEP4
LPSPLDRAFEAHSKKCDIKAVVLDKDDCFAYPDTNDIYPAYTVCVMTIVKIQAIRSFS